MKKTIFLLFLIVIFILSSCNRSQEQETKVEIQSFPQIKNLASETTGITTLTRGNVELLVVDSLLVIQKDVAPFIEVYDTNTNLLITSFGEEGEGPGMFLRPSLSKSYLFQNGDLIIKFYDLQKRAIQEINLKNLITQEEPVVKETPTPFNQFIKIFHYADTDLILGTLDGYERFTQFNSKDSSLIQIPYTPDLPFEVEENRKPYIYKSTVAFNKDKGIFAAFPIGVPSIDFFDLEGNFIRSTYFKNPNDLKNSLEKKELESDERDEPIFFVYDSDSENDFIYGLNYNNSFDEFKNQQSILTFDWEGNSISKYILEQDNPSETMAYDSKHRRFYTYCRDCEESNIQMFNIKD